MVKCFHSEEPVSGSASLFSHPIPVKIKLINIKFTTDEVYLKLKLC